MLNKIILFILILISFSISQTQLSDIDFEESLTDSYGWATVEEANGGGSADDIVTYVAGYSGYAARSSHNSDDGGDDLTIGLGSFPASGELYIKWHVKYESDYNGDCGSIWNVKWLWGSGTNSHNEIGFNGYNFETNVLSVIWQLSGTVGAWASGVTKYGSGSYTMGDWAKIEIYFKLSSGANNDNSDGVQWIKLNDSYLINQTGVITGSSSDIGTFDSPAIKATCSPATGEGWWQIDEFEVWDGIPGEGAGELDTTPPTCSVNVAKNGTDSMDVSVSSISSDVATWQLASPDSGTVLCTHTDNTALDTTIAISGTGWKYAWVKLTDDSSNVSYFSENVDSVRFGVSGAGAVAEIDTFVVQE